MPDDPKDSKDKKLIIDDDWKAQAQREKEELSKELDKDREHAPAAGQLPQVNFINHVASLATQAMMSLGLVEHPMVGQRIYDPEQARYLIDSVLMLKDKTKGNLSKEEQDYIDTVVPELQMTFVEVQRAMARAQMEAGKPGVGRAGGSGADTSRGGGPTIIGA